ncbi:hypothetical protein R1flu_028290 [Riccia fluitans]|uniref:Uncharacterized protein n=1 Tax=Riccia fluitans TaxID=41844 RepID=A0ABD1XLA9_9MARC
MYDLFGSSGKFIGIPNASDNGQRSKQNQSRLTTPAASSRNYDLNRTPPQSVPRQDIGEQSGEVRINSPNVDSPTYEISFPQSRPRGVTRQVVRTNKSPYSKSLWEITKAMKGFTKAYREAKKAKQDGEDKKIALLESIFDLRRSNMFATQGKDNT